MNNKECTRCKIFKPLNEFYNYKNSKDGKHIYCKSCVKEKGKDRYINDKDRIYKYQEKNQEKLKEQKKEYYLSNKDTIKNNVNIWRKKNKDHWNQYQKIWSRNNYIQNGDKVKKYQNEYNRNRYKKDPLYKLSQQLRTLIFQSFKGKFKKQRRTEKILGCSYIELREYIESKFEPWMSWENQGKYNGKFNHGWDIDHIIPVSSAKNEEEIYQLNHFSNLQPLCSKINRDIKREKL